MPSSRAAILTASPEQIGALRPNAALVHADAIAQRFATRGGLNEPPLDRAGGGDGGPGLRKFCEHAVAAGRKDAAAVRGDGGVYGAATCAQGGERLRLVRTHRATVVRRVGGEDCGGANS